MTVLGNQPSRTFSDIVTDFFTGDGSTTIFTLSRTPPNASGLDVTIQGITQPSNCFSIDNNILTFVEPPPITDTDEIAIVHRYGLPLNVGQVPQNSVLRSNIATGAVGPNQLTVDNSELNQIVQNFRVINNTPNAVYRSLHDKVTDIVNIKDYGAVCDGVTDDTQALLNAINDNQERGLLIEGPTRIATPDTINLINVGVYFLPGGKIIADFNKLFYAELENRGTGYINIPTAQVVPSNGDGQNAAIRVHMEVENITIANIGGGYSIGEQVTITGGVFNAPIIIEVLTLGAGNSIATFRVVNRGDYTVLPTSPVIQGSTTGSGINATFSITSWRAHSLEILAAGSGYTAIPTFSFVGGGGSGIRGKAYGTPLGFDASLNAGEYEILSLDRGGNYTGHYGYSNVSVKWFGAVGDGIMDDTDSIQMALNQTSTVFFPKGTFLISNELKIKSQNQSLIGNNQSESVIKTRIPFNGLNMVQNFMPKTNNLGTLDTILSNNPHRVNIENLGFYAVGANIPNISIINLVNTAPGSSVTDCTFNSESVDLASGVKNAIKVNTQNLSTGFELRDCNINGNYNDIIVQINASDVIVNNIHTGNAQKESISITGSKSAIIEKCVFDGVEGTITAEGVVVMEDCMNGTIRNTRIWNSGAEKTFPAIYFKGINDPRNYSVEQCSFSGEGFTGNFSVNIQDDDTNSTISGIVSEIIRYNRNEIIAPNLQVYGRGQIVSNTILGGLIGRLPIANTFSNGVPLVLPYRLDTGNHAVEVIISGRNITTNMPFIAKVVLMNADNNIGGHPTDAFIVYHKNEPGVLGLAYNNGLQNWTLTLDSGTVNNCVATILGNGVYSSSYGN